MSRILHTVALPLNILVPVASGAVEGASRPNILFIMSDDHTTQAIGAYGWRLVTLNPTPTFDRTDLTLEA